MVLRPFRPEAETLDRYTDRVQRQAMALELAEAPLGEGVLDHLLSRAYYEDLVFTQARQDTAMQVRIVRREFAKEYVLGVTGSEVEPDHEARLSALSAMLTERGIDVESLKASFDVLQGPPPVGPRVQPAAGAGRTLPGSVPRTPERYRMNTGLSTGGDVTPAESRTNQAELDAMKERMTGLELELAAQVVDSPAIRGLDSRLVLFGSRELRDDHRTSG